MRAHERSGVHVLGAGRELTGVVTATGARPGTVIYDLGAGPGTFTTPLAATGARVIAVERSQRFLRLLRERFDGVDNVVVLELDLRDFRPPARPFQAVGSIPFGLSTPLMRTLLSSPTSGLRRADLVVEWGFAKRLTDPNRRGGELERWRRRFAFELIRRIDADRFEPASAVDCAHLAITRSTRTGGRRS